MNAKIWRKITVAVRGKFSKKSRTNAISEALVCTKKHASELEPLVPVTWATTPKPTQEAARIQAKLQQIADALPTTGHSMGSVQYATVGKHRASCDRTQEYAKSCTYRANHGSITLKLTARQYMATSVIGGVVTIVTGNTKSPRIKKCLCIERIGQKHTAKLEWSETCVVPSLGYHGTYDQCMDRLNRVVKHVRKNARAGRADSLNAGNCAIGTDAFIRRHHLDPSKKYSKKQLYEIATATELHYVKRIFGEA